MSGYLAHNVVCPDEGLAVVVLSNSDSTEAPRMICRSIAEDLGDGTQPKPAPVADRPKTRPEAPPGDEARQLRVREILSGLASGKIDRNLLTDDCNDYFSDEALRDYAATLAPLGEPENFLEGAPRLRGGLVFREYTVRFPKKVVLIWTRLRPDGMVHQYMVFRSPE